MTEVQALEPNDLPDIENFASFQFLSSDGKTIGNPAPNSCIIPEFVFSRKRWGNVQDRPVGHLVTPPYSNRRGAVTNSQATCWTLEKILSKNTQNWQCVLCGRKGDNCLGKQCVLDFRQNSSNAWESLEIRDTDKTQYGVYCKGTQYIPAGSIIGEYIGELLPPNTDVNEVLKNDAYGFEITGVGYVTAKTYGNWTRFVNHSCIHNNVMTRRIMYGKRLVVAFIAKTDIHPGDQLYSNYGRSYFVNMDSKCVCNDWNGNGAPHLPPTSEEIQLTGRLPVPAPDVIDTVAYMHQLRNISPSNTGQPPPAFTESRTFEIDVSAGGNLVATKEFKIPRSALADAGRNKTIDIDLVLRRRGGRGGGVRKPLMAATTRAPGQMLAGSQGPKVRASKAEK